MNWNKLIRQTHRWLSIVFTVLVIINFIVNIVPLVREEVILELGFLTLLPLAVLLLTGLYLFVLPYIARRMPK